MDVLIDVKKADEDAERIEQDYGSKAAELLASVATRLDERRQELTAELDGELSRRTAELDRQFHSEQETIVASGRKQREEVEGSARSHHDPALQLILKRIQR